MTKHSTTPAQKQSFAKWLEGQLDFRKWRAGKRIGRNPKTGAEALISPRRVVVLNRPGFAGGSNS